MGISNIIPLMESLLNPTGFPSQAEDYIESSLNLHQLLIKHPSATFFMKAAGDECGGICAGDILVVDRALTPKKGDTIVAVSGGELVLKVFSLQECEIWGVVTYVIHKL